MFKNAISNTKKAVLPQSREGREFVKYTSLWAGFIVVASAVSVGIGYVIDKAIDVA